jgi:glycosyltransferase involved in cell wall biosynthesis
MKLLIVDPNLCLTSPSMKGVVRSLPLLKERGWEIEAWCWECDPGLPVDRIVKLPRLGRMHTIGGYAFGIWARWRAWWRFSVKREPRPEVIYTVAWYLPQCDVVHVHFSPWDWEQRQRRMGMRSLRDVFERVVNLVSLPWAHWFLRCTTARVVLSVSEAVANDLRRVAPRLPVRVLPNGYDPKRFHAGVREDWRVPMRNKLGFAQEDKVFVFVSAGHYRRKGFFMAVDAMEVLRRSGRANARLLVVGGTEKRLAGLQRQLNERHADWREFVTFTGMVPDVERYFAASDALLFPSWSEAFALVEVEAAASGLPLFLTPHHGSEMILTDGINGRLLDFDAIRIASVLGEFLDERWRPQPGVHLKHGLDGAAYAERFAEEMQAALERAVPTMKSDAENAALGPVNPTRSAQRV